MDGIAKWFSELNWKSFCIHAFGVLLLVGTPDIEPQVRSMLALIGLQAHADAVVHISQAIGILMNIWGRSPAVTPLGTIAPQSNVK